MHRTSQTQSVNTVRELLLLRLCLCLSMVSTAVLQHVENVQIQTDHLTRRVTDMFVGVTIDSAHLYGNLALNHLRDPILLKYAKELAPGYVRVGGTESDHMLFGNITGARHSILPEVWDALLSFCQQSGLELIFGFNALARKDGKWDPTNARSLLNYSASKGYKIAGFELGNEPDAFRHNSKANVTFGQLGIDFQTVKHVLESTPYKNSLLLGPDPANYRDDRVKQFLSNGGDIVDVITYHSYYFNGRWANIADYYNAKILDSIAQTMRTAVKTGSLLIPPKPVWMGETTASYGGGTNNVTDRYVMGFAWMDKLGLAAKNGVKGVMRQTLFSTQNGLLRTFSNMDPTPDYWLTVLYKKLVGNKVFDVPHTSSRNIRVYAHCTKHNNEFNYKPGSLTVYAMNLNTNSIKLQFSSVKRLDVFWLTPEHGDLHSKTVQLNGKTLSYSGDKMPTFTAQSVSSSVFTVPARTFGFIVLPDADIVFCRTPVLGTILG